MANRPTLFIINPAAGAGAAGERWYRLEPQFRRVRIAAEIVRANQPGTVFEIAKEAAGRVRAIIAVGGDGTGFEVVSGLLASGERNVHFGIVPLGTGNDFADTLGIRTEEDAVRAISNERVRQVDVIGIECENHGHPVFRHAVLFAAVGIIGKSLSLTTPRVKRMFGQRRAYAVGLLRALWAYQAPAMRVTCDRHLIEGRFLFVGASNTERAGGGMNLAPGALIDDGHLNMNLIENVGTIQALAHLIRLRRGRHVDHPRVRYFKVGDVSVEADVPIEVTADGEIIGCTPARFCVKPRLLPVLTNS